MIDDKKIEDAAKQHSEESYISDYFQACYKDAFIESAKWTINEFLKDLWHPVSEEPREFAEVLAEPVWIVSRGDEGGSWWEVNRVPEFYKGKED